MKKSDYLNKINEYYAGTKAPNYDKDSPMSTTTQNDWAERFDKEFPNLRMYYSDGLAPCEDDVKAFIAKELADAKKAVLETIPNPSYSQAEVDRLVADARKEVIEEVEKLPSLAHSMA